LNADVPGVLIAQQRVGVVDCAEENTVQDGQRKFRHDQPPKPGSHRLVSMDGIIDAINYQLRNPEKPNRHEGCEYPRDQSKDHDAGARVPYDLEHGWDIAER
jgi:hypothetical protein